MNHIFGPVQSRRLGRSLGIDLFPTKICTLDCIYCEVGPTRAPVTRRGPYSPVADICAEIDSYCCDEQRMAEVDVVTVTASGEPTLHSGLGEILAHLRQRCRKPVAVLTNGTTLHDPDIRKALLQADLVVPSLDAARPESFAAVDRPAPDVDLVQVIEGLHLFCKEFTGRIWLEILLVQAVNDSPADLAALIKVLRGLQVERIQLNTVVRPPAEPWAQPVPADRLAEIAGALHQELALPVDLPSTPAGQAVFSEEASTAAASTAPSPEAVLAEIRDMVQRRPCTAADIDRTFHLGGPEKVEQLLDPLVGSGSLYRQEHGGLWYYLQPS